MTTVQIREVVERLVAADQWRPGDPKVLVVLDTGYDTPRIAHLLDDLPLEILGRLRSDRVMRRPAPSRKEFSLANPKGGRLPKHGGEFVFGDPATRRPGDPATWRPGDLGHRAGRDGHGHPALWEGDRAGVGPAALTADPRGCMARPRRAAAHHRGVHHLGLLTEPGQGSLMVGQVVKTH